jgi:hypothetical protein
MSSILGDSWETYAKNIRLVLLFSIPFIIAFVIPLLAPLPTYVSSGGIFLRSASIFQNVSAVGVSVIILSLFLSLLFISFAFVAISLIVKGERTYTKHPKAVIRDIERYTGKVFVVLLLYALVLVVSDMLSFPLGIQGIVTPVVGFVFSIAIFYAPTAIVIDNKRIFASLKQSVMLVITKPSYFVTWFVLIAVVIALIDIVVIAISGATGATISTYLLLVINSLFVLPYFIVYQAEAYMRRFPVLRR